VPGLRSQTLSPRRSLNFAQIGRRFPVPPLFASNVGLTIPWHLSEMKLEMNLETLEKPNLERTRVLGTAANASE
jgi:hypothetical protein